MPSRYRPLLDSSVSGDLEVLIDQAKPANSDKFERFTYTPNPTVSDIIPKRGLAAGGIPITVTGDWLNSIQKPLIVLFSENYTASFPCQKAADRKVMTCAQPSYPYPVAAGKSVEANVTFVMDDVPRMSLQLDEPFSIRSNPVLEPLSPSGRIKFNVGDEDHITLEGSNLDVVDVQYYSIRIGDVKWCNVTNLAATVSFVCMYLRMYLLVRLFICMSVFDINILGLLGLIYRLTAIAVFCLAAEVHPGKGKRG